MLETGADIVVGTVPVVREDAKGFGVMLVNKRGQITNFHEKPKEDEALDALKLIVQGSGRSIRSIDDYAITYILDGNFGFYGYLCIQT